MKKLALLASIAVLGLLVVPGSKACMYFDKNYDRKLFRETEREAFFFRDAEAVNLVLKTGFEGKMPPALAWVFPLPSRPISYAEADPKIFTELRNEFNAMLASGGGMSKGLDAPASANGPRSAIAVHKTVTLEGYEIVPIEILSEKGGGEELNTWLRKQNFNELPERIQKPYLKKGACFLAIRMKPHGEKLEVKPLWVRYKAKDMDFPLRFTHDDRTFDLTIYSIGNREPNRNLPPYATWNWLDVGDLRLFRPRLPAVSKISEKALDPVNLRRIEVKGVNTLFKTADLKNDPGV